MSAIGSDEITAHHNYEQRGRKQQIKNHDDMSWQCKKLSKLVPQVLEPIRYVINAL
jgi:hypothetical protein